MYLVEFNEAMNPQLHDIFSRKKPIIKKEIPKIEIQVDHREKNSLVPAHLTRLGYEVKFKELPVADYIVRNVAIERKTISDFISSMINKRLTRQLEELQQYPLKILIIEGIEEQELYNDHEINGIHPNAIRGFLLTILLRWNVPVLFSHNSKDTATYIHLIAAKKEQEISLRASKRVLNPKEQAQFILEGFPGIGPKSAKKLLGKFESLTNIFNASEEELRKILGKKSESFRKILDDTRE